MSLKHEFALGAVFLFQEAKVLYKENNGVWV
ncbi:hypothetical protein DFQ01_11630 [Paenibacillus cellulosilyticus]|uniref:Uncharacterized protein n=1 Tax=Paenibacillus cellulosilyticus TaxID=375489 RepID=A0A2V2YQ42_9BACL|nr:hypothetical protein DFQ01_11630 [Paenibacillus cellulosilyticus]